jgi:ABC-type antimicrobial peptide transport system permease subunit
LYIAYSQESDAQAATSVSVRVAGGSPPLLARSLSAALGRVHPGVVITTRTLSDQVDAMMVRERITAAHAATFGGLALLMAAHGLYGITAYGVSRRRTEIGLRIALGAAPGGVVRHVLRRVILLIVAGAAGGAAISVWASRFVSPLLFGLTPHDPGTLAAALALLAVIGLLAGWLPARRAARLDPSRVLRDA